MTARFQIAQPFQRKNFKVVLLLDDVNGIREGHMICMCSAGKRAPCTVLGQTDAQKFSQLSWSRLAIQGFYRGPAEATEPLGRVMKRVRVLRQASLEASPG